MVPAEPVDRLLPRTREDAVSDATLLLDYLRDTAHFVEQELHLLAAEVNRAHRSTRGVTVTGRPTYLTDLCRCRLWDLVAGAFRRWWSRSVRIRCFGDWPKG